MLAAKLLLVAGCVVLLLESAIGTYLYNKDKNIVKISNKKKGVKEINTSLSLVIPLLFAGILWGMALFSYLLAKLR